MCRINYLNAMALAESYAETVRYYAENKVWVGSTKRPSHCPVDCRMIRGNCFMKTSN